MYRIIFFSVALMCAFVSCTYKSVHLLDENDYEWLEAYDDGDTILFESNDGIDTMIVARIIHNTPSSIGINCFSGFYANGMFDNQILHKGLRYKCGLIVHRILQDSTGLVLSFDERISYNKLSPKDFEIYEKEGVVYDDAFVIGNRYSSVADNFEEVTKYFIWSKSKGLVEYKYLNGEVYTFYKKIPREK